MQKTTKFLIFLVIFFMLAMPTFSLAQTDTDDPDLAFKEGKSLVPCGHANPQGLITNPCSFKDALTLINGVIRFILFDLVVPIAAIMFFYAGFQLVTSGGSTEKRGLAKKVFTNAVIGLVIAAAAWLIVRTILSILNPAPGFWSWIGF